MTTEIDEYYRIIKCDHCNRIIEKKIKYYYDRPNIVLLSVDVCKDCTYQIRLK